MRKWTVAERAAHSVLIHTWKPWQSSTGPRSRAGKVRVSQNTTKHGMYSKQAVALQRALAGLLDDVEQGMGHE